MKVFFINVVCGVGSTGRMCTEIAEALTGEGNAVEIAYGRGGVPADYRGTIYRVGNVGTLAANLIRSRLFDAEGFGNRRAAEKLVAEIKRFAPDVIHLHNLHGYYLNVQVLFDYLKEFQGAVIWTLHDCWAFTGHCAHYDALGCQQWQLHCRECPALREYPACLLSGRVDRNYTEKQRCFLGVPGMTLATPSYWLQEQVAQSFLSGYDCQVIQNGIDHRKFYRDQSETATLRRQYHCEQKYLLLAVAYQWEANKGLEDYIRLAAQLPDRYQLVLVGTDSAVAAKLPKNMIAVPRTENIAQLRAWYNAADLFVNFTYNETFSLVNIEALACGTPVLTYHTGGSPECIDSTCGADVEKGNVSLALKEIMRICEERPFSPESCMKRAALFRSSRQVKAYIALYQQALESRRPQVPAAALSS
ncbi:MAG: glycosyltransferase [Eubacterium sp.]|nr:glycosyltransferase [Eubacterium sp.]